MATQLRLTARIVNSNQRHSIIAVWQNGGKAGELTVDTDVAKEVVEQITTVGEEFDQYETDALRPE